MIQTFKQLYDVGGDAFEKTSYKLDFVGNVVEERTTQTTSSGVFRLGKKYTYDHQDRLLTIKHTFKSKVGSDSINLAEYTHVANNYNEVGLLSKKELHNSVQKQNYKYTPRSWMASTVNDGGKTFSLGLSYNSNGNINNLSWQTHTQGARSFSLSYDGANRLDAATGSLQENISYDKNGNITALSRGGGAIDNLTYNYGSNSDNSSNLLKWVNDSGSNEGFDNNGTGTNEDYTYDSNGNLTKDLNKKVSAINYNVLNLPREVNFTDSRTVQYVYDASGAKLKTANPGGTTFYAGAFEYNSSGVLQRIALEEGQLVKNGDNYDINYYLKDHLGNVRMVLKQEEEGTVLQETEYYPFGLAVSRSGTDAQNKYTFLGKEKQPETSWIDLQARFYDPALGRFFNIDPETEGQLEFSPYHYSFNNPIRFSDPDGRFPDCCGGVGDFLTGVGQAFTEDFLGSASPITASPGYVGAYNSGRTAGHYAAMVVGATEVAAGIIGDVGAVVGEIGSVGIATPVAVPVAAASTTVILHGTAMGSRAAENLRNDKGRVNADSHPNSNKTSGNNSAAQIGKQKHKELAEKVKQKPGWKSEPSIVGKDLKTYKPDVETLSGNLLEYKPRTPTGESKGKTQAKKYENQTGKKHA